MYTKLRKIVKRLVAAERLDAANHTNTYWDIQKELNVELRLVLDDKPLMAKMTKRQLVQVLAWCCTHRPYEPHSILGDMSQLNDHMNSEHGRRAS